MMAYRAIDTFYPVVPDAAWVARLVKAGVLSEHEARQIMRIESHDDYVEPTT